MGQVVSLFGKGKILTLILAAALKQRFHLISTIFVAH